MKLRLAPEFTLPLEVATQTLGLVTYPDRGTLQAALVLFLEGAR